MALLYRPDSPLPPDAEYRVARTDASPTMLLPGHDPAWSRAERITWGPDRARTSFAALWNPRGLAIRFDVCDEDAWHTMTRRDDPIWEEEVVEIFLDPTRTGRGYAELEISPINVVTDLVIHETTPALVNDLRWNWMGLESTVIPGSCEGMRAGSWVALAWLPWAGLATVSAEAPALLPPASGDTWHFNVFRIKRPGGPAAPERDAVYAAWSAPDGPTFHAPGSFRPFRFA
jgi:hypothetical protein